MSKIHTHAPKTSHAATVLAVVKAATVDMVQHTVATAACPTATQLPIVDYMRGSLAKVAL
ncbi:uncharacterized protein N7515_009743 [Penicillium bovifimosum]|uniref:Uncharacterized protein n=1 Tax=Penicillium bovifimosum TaxID=126998 RepID=A0A9W9GHJ5_9EURO|nr:uncharacterized protein N7515_009743 [Penicillium bovifimosum]KAJ5120355.1 hypothetical protein N7515_009743 [Penicillium bovifimosum]